MEKHNQTLLTGISILLYGTSLVGAISTTRRLEGKPLAKHWKEYIPSATLFVTATGLLIFVNTRYTTQVTALTQAYNITRTALDDLKATVSPKQLANAESSIAQITADRLEIPKNQLVLAPNQVYCIDHVTGQQFVSTVENVHRACQALNYEIIHHSIATMDDYCDGLGISHVQGGGNIGWTSGPITFKMGTKLKDEMYPVLVISVDPLPKPL